MRKITILALLLVLAVPAPAWAAARVIAPPGNSEADQYFETLPGPTGPHAPASTQEAREGALSEGTEQALLRRGKRRGAGDRCRQDRAEQGGGRWRRIAALGPTGVGCTHSRGEGSATCFR